MNDTPLSPGNKDTFFAPAGRMDPAEVRDLRAYVEQTPLFQVLLDALDGYLMILNPQRQVLALNKGLLDALGVSDVDCLTGGRPGEVLGCIHAAEGPDGCGTGAACKSCGAVIAILASQIEGRPSSGECLATVRRGEVLEALEYRIRATPVTLGPNEFTVLSLNDISGDKRRDILERTFFHDLLNTVGGLMGWSTLLTRMEGMDSHHAAERILALSRRLKQEIEDQRRLVQAEHGTLETTPEETAVGRELEALGAIFELHESSRGKQLEIAGTIGPQTVTTDASLLLRVLTNMVKNALEAVGPGEMVRVWFERAGGRPAFYVHNATVIPEDVATRIFQRSFSTKAATGRGIGTYSMKLFGERYLGGEVGFESAEGAGTTFWIKLPPEARE